MADMPKSKPLIKIKRQSQGFHPFAHLHVGPKHSQGITGKPAILEGRNLKSWVFICGHPQTLLQNPQHPQGDA